MSSYGKTLHELVRLSKKHKKCALKKDFRSRSEAASFRKNLKIKNNKIKYTKPYNCPHCEYWHLTSTNKKPREARP